MKKLFFIALAIVSTVNGIAQTKSVFSLKGEIANSKTDTIKLINFKDRKDVKKILVDKAGSFKGTFPVEEGIYIMYVGDQYAKLFLKNGYDLKLKINAQGFDESLMFSGKGAADNNFLAQNALTEKKYDYNKLLESNEEDFAKLINEKKTANLLKLEDKKLDPNLVALLKKDIEATVEQLTSYHKQSLEVRKLNGTMSPSFDYDNYKGGKTKLEDFKGKYVYIDVWATWCGPCRREIPHLKEVEEKYHDKNIAFISISIDKAKDVEKWKTMVKEKELGGVQIIADNDWNSQFVKDYKINGIPRFILLDPNGKIIKADAERPSNPKLQEELDALLK